MDESRLSALHEQGVVILDPRQTYVADEVALDRIRPGSTLYPGTRLMGARTFVGEGASVGTHGPATLVDAVLGEGARIDSGYAEGAVLLRGAALGANAHARPGTLLEEQASTAHCVGLKQTILLSFVTLGSLINFCDVLMAGGSSRKDHSEVGSGFIHFNFTPWGKRGDKATPSMIGDVSRGVFLREPRIFLGGSGGLAGPRHVGFGSITGAGQVVRKDIAEETIHIGTTRTIHRKFKLGRLTPTEPVRAKNIAYIAQLVALRAFYRGVRLQRASARERPVIEAAIETIDIAIAERRKRIDAFLVERGADAINLAMPEDGGCPLPLARGPELDHIEWLASLEPAEVSAGQDWLVGVTRYALESMGTS